MYFPREIGLKRQVCSSEAQFDRYVSILGAKTACYTSLYHYEALLPDKRRVDYNTAVIDRAWWDFDSGPAGDINVVKEDVAALLSRLDGGARIVATGRGFHVHQLFSEPVAGNRWAHRLDLYQRSKGEGLQTLDGVAHTKKLTRIPGTFNPKRWRWAVNIDVAAFAQNPHGYKIPQRPDPSLDWADPLRGEIPSDALDFDSWFDSYGSELTKDKPQGLTFTPVSLPVGGTGAIPIPPCLERTIHHPNPPHHVRVALAQHLSENLRLFAPVESLTPEQKDGVINDITDFIRGLSWRDFSEYETRKHVRSILKYNRTPSCAWFKARSMCPAPCWRDDGTMG